MIINKEKLFTLKSKLNLQIVILAFISAILTIIRFYIGVNIPLYIQGGAVFDDYLFTRYALNILDSGWIGQFNSLTLAKTVSFPWLVVLTYKFNIPYSYALCGSYILSVAFFVFAFNEGIRNRFFTFVAYVFMLFSPVMIHEENVQKIYRGGYIVVFSLLVLSSIIGLFFTIENDKLSKPIIYSVLGIVSFPVFWFLKEDSIWILPIYIVGTLCAFVKLIRKYRDINMLLKKIILLIMPLCVLALSIIGYKYKNYHEYGEFTVTDRSGTNFKNVISDIMMIEDENVGTVWITKEMINKAADNSSTLNPIMPYIDERYESWGNGNAVEGDIIIWALREAFDRAGVYDQGGEKADEYYKAIHDELQQAFDAGRLYKAENRIRISSISVGFTREQLSDYYSQRLPKILKMIISYSENITSANPATGDGASIDNMVKLAKSKYVLTEASDKDLHFVNLSNKIVSYYQRYNPILFVIGCIGFVLLAINAIIKHEKTSEELLLVCAGMIGTAILLVFAVMWFCNFLSDRKVYDYVCATIPLMEMLEIIGFYVIISSIAKFAMKKNYVSDKGENI